MRKFIVVVLLATAVFFSQRRGAHETAPDTKSVASKTGGSPTPRLVYEHDWAKHSLDRAHAVEDQVERSRKENDQP